MPRSIALLSGSCAISWSRIHSVGSALSSVAAMIVLTTVPAVPGMLVARSNVLCIVYGPVGSSGLGKGGKAASDAFVVRVSPDGKIAWGKDFGAGREDSANGVAVRGDRVVVVGQFLDRIDLGPGLAHPSSGSDDMF